LLHHLKDGKTKVGFIHIPYSKEQEKEPSMDLSDITKGLMIAIENID
jgi:pyroglutamyl-peptidase